LGRLFQSSSKGKEQQVLMMFIRPTIIRNPEDAKNLSDERFQHLISRDLDGKKKSLLSDQLKEIVEQEQSQKVE
jgi:general secretion pathway protein D